MSGKITIRVEPDDVASVVSGTYDHYTILSRDAGGEALGLSEGDTYEMTPTTPGWHEVKSGDACTILIVESGAVVIRLAEVSRSRRTIKLRNANTRQIDLVAEEGVVEILGVVGRIVNRERDGSNYWRGAAYAIATIISGISAMRPEWFLL